MGMLPFPRARLSQEEHNPLSPVGLSGPWYTLKCPMCVDKSPRTPKPKKMSVTPAHTDQEH